MVSADIKAKAEQWLKQDFCAETRKEIEDLLAADDEAELTRRLAKRIAFGTAGLRANMKAGFANMNQLTVCQASQGLCVYLEKQFGEDGKKRGIAVGFDGRYNSDIFAKITAATFISRGFKVYLFREYAVTPMVPYTILKKGCVSGVVVTASHNPKADNGYKVYWDTSAQILPPHDAGIAKSIEENLEPWGVDLALADKAETAEPIIDEYMKEMTELHCNTVEANKASTHKMVYSAMHGVGTPFIQKIFKAFQLPDPILVDEQCTPDPEFSTVAKPNPEEGKGSLTLSIKKAKEVGAKVILASDPDADRLAVAEEQPDGEFKIFSGNELGLIFGEWVWRQKLRRDPGFDKSKGLMMASTVSSKALKAVADKEGFHFGEALTGFKWIGGAGKRIADENGWELLFGFEEAIGFMLGKALDKDGVSAAAAMAELYISVANEGKRLSEHLDSLYAKYGYFASYAGYHIVPGDKQQVLDGMTAIFDKLRSWEGKPNTYPAAAGPYKIKSVRDLETLYDSSKPDNKADMPHSAFMITFTFDNGCVATIRGSGTEPKLKFYGCVDGNSMPEAEKLLNDMLSHIYELAEPAKHGLTLPKSE